MAFRFDKLHATKPARVSWKIDAATHSALEQIATQEGATVQQVAQQMLDHVLEESGGKKSARRARRAPGGAG